MSPAALATGSASDRQNFYAFAKANLPAEPPKAVTNVSWRIFAGSSGSSYTLVQDYEYPTKYVEVTTVLKPIPGSHADAVDGFHFNIISKKQLPENNLIPNKNFQWVILIAVLSIVGVTLFTLVQTFVRRGVKRRWLWFIIVLIGVGSLRVNWATGDVFLMLLSVQLFSFSAFRGLSVASPWFVQLSLPLGAIIFLARARVHAEEARFEARKRARALAAERESVDASTPET
jgi:hypothetical protein